MLGLDPRGQLGGRSQVFGHRRRQRAQIDPDLSHAVLAIVEIEGSVGVVGSGAERHGLQFADGWRYAQADLALLAQTDVHPPVRPGPCAAEDARQQHRGLVPAVVAESDAEAAGGRLPDHHCQLASFGAARQRLQPVADGLEQPRGVEPINSLVELTAGHPGGRSQPEGSDEKPLRDSTRVVEPERRHQDRVGRRHRRPGLSSPGGGS